MRLIVEHSAFVKMSVTDKDIALQLAEMDHQLTETISKIAMVNGEGGFDQIFVLIVSPQRKKNIVSLKKDDGTWQECANFLTTEGKKQK